MSDWVDLSHQVHASTPHIALFEPPRVTRIRSIPDDPMNVTALHMVCHTGTHLDAPCHFVAGGRSIDQLPLDRLVGPGVVLPVPAGPYEVIEAEALSAARPEVRAGDIVLLDTGWARHAGTERYDRHPSLSVGAAHWLVERHVKLVGVDFATPDLPVALRPQGFNWPVHHILLANEVLIGEHLTNVESLSGRRVEVMFLALNVRDADGAPARVVARAT